MDAAGLRTVYTPRCRITRQFASWESGPEHERMNRIRFFSKWTGYLWQDDENYLKEDGLTHDALSALYRELAARIASGPQTQIAFPALSSL
jgi:hypothetical protein